MSTVVATVCVYLWCVHVYVYVFVCACVCVCERASVDERACVRVRVCAVGSCVSCRAATK